MKKTPQSVRELDLPDQKVEKASARRPVEISTATTRRRYSSPKLRSFGDIRSMTFGGSIGNLDSANPGIQKP